MAAALAVALGFLVLARRRPGWWSDTGRAAGVLGAARSPFAVILAFVILVAFQAFNDARKSAEEEASATRNLFKVADLLHGQRQEQIQENVICYSRAVINLDWPQMRDGGSSHVVDDNAADLEDIAVVANLTGEVSPEKVQPVLEDANTRDQARADRLSEATGTTPGPVWAVLLIGTVSVLAYVILFADPKERLSSQAVMVGSVTLIVTGGLILVWFLSNPYEDNWGSIRPTAMERTLQELEDDPEFAKTVLEPACDEQGNPQAPEPETPRND